MQDISQDIALPIIARFPGHVLHVARLVGARLMLYVHVSTLTSGHANRCERQVVPIASWMFTSTCTICGTVQETWSTDHNGGTRRKVLYWDTSTKGWGGGGGGGKHNNLLHGWYIYITSSFTSGGRGQGTSARGLGRNGMGIRARDFCQGQS